MMLKFGKHALVAATMALCGGGCGRTYIVYDQYLDTAGQARVGKSKNVYVESSGYSSDLIVVELKAKGYTVDAGKADFRIGLSSDIHAGTSVYSRFVVTALTFTVTDGASGKILFSRIGLYNTAKQSLKVQETQDFIRENLGLFQGIPKA